MKKLLSKRVISLAIAIVMAVSIFALSASAASPEVGFAPGTNAQFWFKYDTLDPDYDQYPQELTIDDEPYEFTLGNNTIQEYVFKGSYYVITTHPQYFGTTYDYDDQNNAEYVMNFRDILVYNPQTQRYDENCFEDGFLTVPAGYAVLDEDDNPIYLQCMVYSIIEDINDTPPIPFEADWNGSVVYLAIPVPFPSAV
jgi:hypothetical protein